MNNSTKKLSYIILSVVLLITVFFAFQLPKSSLDYNFEDFFPKKDESTKFYNNYRKHFASDNDFLLISIERQKGVFDIDFLNQIHDLSKKLDQLDNVSFTANLTTLQETFIYSPGVITNRKYINLDSIDLANDSIFIFKNKELVNTFINESATAVSIFLQHKDYLSKEKCDQLVQEINEIYPQYNFEKVRVAGRSVGQKFYLDTMLNELYLFITLGFILVVLFLWFTFRSIRNVLLPQAIIVGSLIWTFGTLAFFNKPINILLIVLPPILLVVSMSDVMHLLTRYRDLIDKGLEKNDALKLTIKEIGAATFLTTITTTIGFFSLIFVSISPIQDFGFISGLGVVFTFILTYATLPALFYLTPKPVIKEEKRLIDWNKLLHGIFLLNFKNQKLTLLISGGLIVTFGFGALQLKSDNYITDNLHPKSELRQDFDYFDNEFGGVRPFELAVELKDSSASLWDKNTLKSLSLIEDYLNKEYGVIINNSLVQSLSILNRGAKLGDANQFKIPETAKEIKRLRQMMRIKDQGKFISSIMDSTERLTRISGRVPDFGSRIAEQKNQKLYDFIKDNKLDDDLIITSTGSAELYDKSMKFMSISLLQSMLLAIAVVSLLLALSFRSFRMMFISLLVNLIPLLVLAGVMGYLGINFNMTTAIVFTISFGIAVDDTIHFTNDFRLERRKDLSKIIAIRRSYLKTGKAIILTSLILFFGFFILVFSSFMGIFYLGLLASITMLAALLCDLFILPLLIYYFID